MFRSRTEKGNVATSPTSQEDADLRAKAMDDAYCENCVYCTDCSYCKNCAYCTCLLYTSRCV